MINEPEDYGCCVRVDDTPPLEDEPAPIKGNPAPRAMAYVLWAVCWLALAYAILYGVVGFTRWVFGWFGVY